MEQSGSTAAEHARKAFEAQPHNINLAVNYAHHLLQEGQTGLALNIARQANNMDPDNFRACRFLSGAFAVSGNLQDALSAAERAILINPDDSEVRLHVSSLLIRLQRPRAAVSHLMMVCGGPNETSSSWRQLSSVLTELGRPDRALIAVDRAIELAPKQVELRIHRASLLISRGRHQEALEELSVAAEVDPESAAVLRTRSGLLELLDKRAEALSDAEKAVVINSENSEYRRHLAFLRLQAGVSRKDDFTDDIDSDNFTEGKRFSKNKDVRSRKKLITTFIGAFKLQSRIIISIMLRDMRTRFGRSRLGYFWQIMEPIGHLLTLGSVFAFLNHGRAPLGSDLYIFYVTGLIPFLMFSHVVVEMMPVLSSNTAVLSLPIVKNVDVMLAKAILALATDAFVAIIVFSGFVLLGRPGTPNNLMTCILALGTLWLFALGFGMVNLILAELFHTWEAIISAVLRLMYFASGIYYSPLLMPAWIREVLIWNPVLQGIEWFRSGFFRQYSPHWLDTNYLFLCTGLVLLIGFSLERALRRNLVVLV